MSKEITSMIQTVYNLNWKGRTSGTVEWTQFAVGENRITIYPTAMDYSTPNETHPVQVKWEIDHANGEKVINLTVKKAQYTAAIEEILRVYLGIVPPIQSIRDSVTRK